MTTTNAALKRPGVWGIDLGQCALKAIRLEDVDGEIKATAFDYIEHPKILSQPDADPDQLTREALEKFLERNDLKGDTIAISVPGQSGLARFVKLPPVDEKKIPDIVRFEAKQQIPFPLEEVVWAYQRLGAGTVSDNMVLDTEVGLFAMKRDMVTRYLQHFKDVNVEIHVIQMAPLALCNFIAHDLLGKGANRTDDTEGAEDKSCIVALDIGADNSNLVITDGEKIIWQRPIPLGGNHFTRALTKDLKLTFAKAEHLKRNAVKSPDLKKILAALKPVLNDFVGEVQRSLGYFTNTHRDATIQYLLGLGNAFRLPGLQKYLQEKLQLEVRKLQKIERLTGEESVTEAPQYVENVLSFAVAHGLALQGLQATRLHTNLLPPEIQQERFIRAKKPWVTVAAAVLLLLSPPLLLGYAANQRAWKNKDVEDAVAKLDNDVKAARLDEQQYNAFKKKIEDTELVVKRLGGGVEERVNWVHLNTILNEALPRPDGKRLLDITPDGYHPFEAFFQKTPSETGGLSGQTAWKEQEVLRLQAAAGKSLDAGQQDKQKKNREYLVQLNIEGVGEFYSDNLPAEFFTKIKDDKLEGMRKDQAEAVRDLTAKKGPASTLPKAGWVVEIRGYTYHTQNYTFVVNTLVANLADLADIDSGKGQRLKKPLLSQPNDPVKFPPDVERILRLPKVKEGDKEVEKPRISHVFLYDYFKVEKPKGGDFTIITSSKVAPLLMGGGPPAPTTTPGPGGPKSDLPAAQPDTPPRLWRPLVATGFTDVFTNTPMARPTVPDPKTSLARLPVRTEFIVVFVWQEPVILDIPAQPEAGKL